VHYNAGETRAFGQRLGAARSEVGTVCVSSASTGLSGGRREIAVPTATGARCARVQVEHLLVEGDGLRPPRSLRIGQQGTYTCGFARFLESDRRSRTGGNVSGSRNSAFFR